MTHATVRWLTAQQLAYQQQHAQQQAHQQQAYQQQQQMAAQQYVGYGSRGIICFLVPFVGLSFFGLRFFDKFYACA